MYKWLFFLFMSFNVFASPLKNLTKVGVGEMDYLFWTVYRAEYYREDIDAMSQKTSPNVLESDRVKALKIEYFKAIKSQVLIDATIDQWQSLGYPNTEIKSWVDKLRKIWPDVGVGNTLTVVVKKHDSHFYFNDSLIGSIDDKRFGGAFLSIWLSKNTSYPDLRLQLLGHLP